MRNLALVGILVALLLAGSARGVTGTITLTARVTNHSLGETGEKWTMALFNRGKRLGTGYLLCSFTATSNTITFKLV